MRRDIRSTALYEEAEALSIAFRQPGSGRISDAVEVSCAPGGRQAVFAGTLTDRLEGAFTTRICQVDLATGDLRVLTFGPRTDRLPRYSPDGRHIAFLSDRHASGDFQLYLLNPTSGIARAAVRVDGWVEYLHWSPDNTRILLGVAGHGADVSGGQGAISSKQAARDVPSWIPSVETGDESYRWRRAWIYELASATVRQVSADDTNIWEAVWCGNEALAAVVSPGPSEALWYSAHLHIIDIATGTSRELYKSRDQLAWPAVTPSGRHVAVVEAICSDRGLVAGDLKLIDVASGKVWPIDTHGVDIACTEWRSERHLLLAGHRSFETVLGLYDSGSGAFSETWSSSELTSGGRHVTVAGLNEGGDCVLVGESFVRAPEIAVISAGQYRSLKSLDPGSADLVSSVEAVREVRWTAPDGLEIQGWLVLPKGKSPCPLIMQIHGGPVWHWRPSWLPRRGVQLLMLIRRGYALFFPNPRGSTGRGQDFARRIVGDMGGADTFDYLSGLDHLVATGIADPKRLGVTGVSYGGFMAAWLITQDARFAAAIPVAPITNFVTEHLISNISGWVALFVGDRYDNSNGNYYQRSPILHARNVRTPTLNICGALDRCTPSEEAVQFHNALLENGVRSVLVMYPEEGHGVRKLPATIDYAARVVAWFEEHVPVESRV